MSIYAKLLDVKDKFQEIDLHKSGHNDYSNYDYFELKDFLKPILGLLSENKLFSYVSFTDELATLTVVDTEDDSKVEVTSPMSTAKLTACHEVQNLGAVQTYLRRYLYMALFDIAEDDAADGSKGVEQKADLSGKSMNDLFKMKVGFGKYKEYTLGKLFKEDHSYFKWLMENANDPNTKEACAMIQAAAPQDEGEE